TGVREVASAPDAEDQGAERVRAAALALRVPGDDELLLVTGLDLEPLATSVPRLVARVGALGEDSLEALFLHRTVGRTSVVERRRDADDQVIVRNQRLEPLAPFRERQLDKRLAVCLEDVEDLVDDGRIGASLLHEREARAAAVVQGADLAVEDAIRRLHRLR